MLDEILLLLTAIAATFFLWQKKTFSYWKNQNVKYIRPKLLFGNLRDLFTAKQSFGEQIWTFYKHPETAEEPVVGLYMLTNKALLIRDLDLIKNVLIKNFNNFSNRYMRADPVHDPVGNQNLFNVRNPKWRDVRTKLSTVFSSGKIKLMYKLMIEVAKELEATIADMIVKQSIIDVKDICARYTTDNIGSIAFGINANGLKNPKSAFFVNSLAVFETSFRRNLEFVIMLLVPRLLTIFRIKVFPKKASEFITKSVQYVLEEREKSGVVRNDLIDTLIAMKREALAQSENSNSADIFNFLVAQAAVFQSAGFETSSSTMAFTLFELALQPHLQDRLRDEITAAFDGSEKHLSYEKLNKLSYLDQIMEETLRKYPALAFLERECTPENGNESFSLKPYSDYNVPSGMAIYISLLGLHRNEKYWPEPEKYDPERFSPENRGNINWNAYMPFGIGPHNCIGMRLGLLQSKLGLVHFLLKYSVLKCDQTPDAIHFNTKSFTLIHNGGLFLKVQRI